MRFNVLSIAAILLCLCIGGIAGLIFGSGMRPMPQEMGWALKLGPECVTGEIIYANTAYISASLHHQLLLEYTSTTTGMYYWGHSIFDTLDQEIRVDDASFSISADRTIQLIGHLAL